jgi:hypothetical protein
MDPGDELGEYLGIRVRELGGYLGPHGRSPPRKISFLASAPAAAAVLWWGVGEVGRKLALWGTTRRETLGRLLPEYGPGLPGPSTKPNKQVRVLGLPQDAKVLSKEVHKQNFPRSAFWSFLVGRNFVGR